MPPFLLAIIAISLIALIVGCLIAMFKPEDEYEKRIRHARSEAAKSNHWRKSNE